MFMFVDNGAGSQSSHATRANEDTRPRHEQLRGGHDSTHIHIIT